MRMKGETRWHLYLLALAINSLLIIFYIVFHQKGSGIEKDLFSGVAIYFNEKKPLELLAYVIGAALFFLVFIIYIAGLLVSDGVKLKGRIIAEVSSGISFEWKNFSNYLHLIIFPVFILLFVPSLKIRVFLQGYILVYAIMILLVPYCAKCLGRELISKALISGFAFGAIVFALTHVAYIFSDHLIGPPKIINEFYSIPEKTRIGSRYVDNTDYYNKQFDIGRSYKWDIEKPYRSGGYVEISLGERSLLRPVLSDSVLYYNGVDKRLYLNGIGVPGVISLYGREDLRDINKYNEYLGAYRGYIKKRYDKEDVRFLAKNKYEYHWQILDRYMLHHHSFILSPVSAYNLGVPLKKIGAQYGLGNIVIFEWIMRQMGGVSLENWLRLNASFYVVYYLMYAFVLFSVFNKINALLIFFASIGLLYAHGYEFLILAPGDSPWRNIFDVVILFFLYGYQKMQRKYYVYLALLLGIISVIINPQIGLMIVIALLISLSIYYAIEKKFSIQRITVLFTVLLIAVYLFYGYSSEGDLAVYYLKGVIGFPVSDLSYLAIFVFIAVGYALLIFLIKDGYKDNLLPLVYIFFYAQALITYYVWHADANGFLARSHIYVLAIVMFSCSVYNKIRVQHKWYQAVYGSIIIMIFVFYAGNTAMVNKEKNRYDDIFESHKVYGWDFKKAKIISTTNPIYFKEAVDLLNKYASDDKCIYLISKYDMILSFLSEKVSGMPFQDLKWYHMTEREVRNSVMAVLKSKPQYLFVDTDINRNYNDDVVSRSMPVIGYLHEESVWRAERLKIMALVFEQVSVNYQLVDKGKILSVYKRIEI